jgi:flagellar biosynthesis anti-sigma factor FlgM
MRVNLTTFGVEPPESGKPGRAAQNSAASTAGATVSGASRTTTPSAADQASFSFDQALVQSLTAQVLAQPEIRQAKVQGLQQAIGKGEYSVPPSQIAAAIAGELAGVQG